MERQGRDDNAMRPLVIEEGFQPLADGSVRIRLGRTDVACAVSVEDRVPPFLEGTGRGWITAEYAMLPGATQPRAGRGPSGRSTEIGRLIGRSLRQMVDLAGLAGYTLRVDCDVLNADGSTRCAAITGGALAVARALAKMAADGRLDRLPAILPVAAVSAGLVAGRPRLDLEYREDSAAVADGNFVFSGDGRLVEVQCTAEEGPLAMADFQQLLALAYEGARQIFATLWEGR